MTAPKAGDRVRVVVEGEVRQSHLFRPGEFAVGATGDCPNVFTASAAHVVSVEVLPPPEPDWQPGDVAVDRIGVAHLRIDDYGRGPWQTFNGEVHEDVFPLRPLTLIVHDAKIVGGDQ